jgi:hypothetical protein
MCGLGAAWRPSSTANTNVVVGSIVIALLVLLVVVIVLAVG